jgi:hypothetical protein
MASTDDFQMMGAAGTDNRGQFVATTDLAFLMMRQSRPYDMHGMHLDC